MADARIVLDGLMFPESARWRAGRLWLAHWGASEVLAVEPGGRPERVGDGPEGYGWSLDWLPDGRMLITGPQLTAVAADGAHTEHGDLRTVAEHGWNEIAVAPNGDVYVNGFAFDAAGGGQPEPGRIALVRPDGTTREVADGLLFPNGMVIADEGRTLVVAESFAGRLTAFDITDDGDLVRRRTWAEGVAPDGICLDAEGAIWCGAADTRLMTGDPASAAGAVVRVREGGAIEDRIEVDRPVFSCALGGDDGRTLFLLAREWDGFDQMDATSQRRTGRVLAVTTDVAAADALPHVATTL